MKRFLSIAAAGLLAASSAQAAPLCSAFLNPDAMPAKYRKLAPVLSAGPADWIITQDQMDQDYAPSPEATYLLSEIVQAFEARGTKLAILMPPPRPLIAGQASLDALTGKVDPFDVDSVSASFNEMVETARAAGAIVPNLLTLATADAELRREFYYRHDTHWTPRGAAESALALAEELSASDEPAFAGLEITQPTWDTAEVFSERGSLADMAKAVCDAQIAPVELPVPAFPASELGLLDDTSQRARILLAGSSFSNRYKRDAYRVADAIAGALHAEVVNHSVSGGGAIGAIEGIVNAGLLDGDSPVDLVVWELPFTEGLKNTGMLRQLLGALQFDRPEAATEIIWLEDSGETRIALEGLSRDVLTLHLPNAQLQRIKIDLRFADGSKQTHKIVRKPHVPAALQSDWWSFSLLGFSENQLVSATVRYDRIEIGDDGKAYLY